MDILPEIVEKVEEEIIDQNVIDEDDDALPDPEPKVKVKKEDVFKDEVVLKSPEHLVADTPIVKKPKRKRKMSEEALKKLAEARTKAHQKRKENGRISTEIEKED